MASPATVPDPESHSDKAESFFPWERLWVHQSGAIQLGGFWDTSDAYLADPDDGFIGKYANAHLLKTAALLVCQPGCLALTGDPGMGKTQTLTRYFSRKLDRRTIRIEFRDIPDTATFVARTTGTVAWRKWRKSSGILTLVVDGVDEGLIKIAGFVSFLAGMLKDEPLKRLQLILACRSLEWPQSEGEALQALWHSVEGARSGVFELCPLLERDVRLAARTTIAQTMRGKSAEDFMWAVRRHQLIGLASRPLTLKMLLREFVAGAGFSKSHRELYLGYARAMCAEVDIDRKHRLRNVPVARLQVDQRKRERVAQRIAALLLLGGRSAIWTGATGGQCASDLAIAEICGETETLDGVEFTVDETMVDSVLETPLFWARGPRRAAFFHQTFAESLAAEYLRTLSQAQLRSLFCRRDSHGEFVHPQLAELAAWVATGSPSFLHHLVEQDPETLLRSDVSAIRESSRAKLVEAVLAKAAAEQLFDARGTERFFHTLRHPRLAQQLRPVIHDRKANLVVRRLALDMAEQCGLTEVCDDILARLNDPRDGEIHSPAAGALDDVMRPTDGPKLLELLTRKRKKPLAAGVQLSVLHALLKHKVLTLTQALPHLKAVLVRRDSSGMIIAQHARPSDAEALLDAAAGWGDCFDGLSPWHALARAGVLQGVARIHEPDIRRRLARLWWRARRAHRDPPFPKAPEAEQKTLRQLLEDADLRRLFAADVAALAAKDRDGHWFFLDEFGHSDDFEHYLGRFEQAPPEQKRAFAQLILASWNYVLHAPYLGRLVALREASPELQECMPWLRLWVLDEPSTIRARETYYEQQRWQTEAAKRRRPREKPAAVWERTFQALDPANRDSVPTLIKCLFYTDQKDEDVEKRDLRTSPGWKHHGKEARDAILAAIRYFLLTGPGGQPHSDRGNSEWDEQAYRALYAVRDEIESTPSLAAAVKQHWLPVIFDEFSNADEHHLEMIAIAYRLDPLAMCTMLKRKVIRAAKNEPGDCYALREFSRCWDAKLADFVVDFTVAEVTNARTVEGIAQFLAEHDPRTALALVRKFRAVKETKAAAFQAALTALVTWRLLDDWDEVWPDLTENKTLARAVLIGLDPHEQRNFLKAAQPGSERKLADLYLYLRELFPPAEDPRIEPGRTYSVTSRMEIGRTRDQLPSSLAAMATEEAIVQLGRIARAIPAKDRIWMRWRQHEAIVANRRHGWSGTEPAIVLQMMQKANRRLLVDEDDLLAVVLESLERLDRKLTRSPNSPKIEFWHERLGRDRKKYYRPREEVDMTRWIASWLESDLDPERGITLQREVQVQWNERTDIEVRAVAVQGTRLRPLQLVIEVKGCWHKDVRTAVKRQLADTYLRNAGWTHGLYLVVWAYCERWNDPKAPRKSRLHARSLVEAREEMAKLTRPFDGRAEPYCIRESVLDVRL